MKLEERGPQQAGSRADEIRQLLRHDDPSQLWFQLGEIVDDRTYLRNGITVNDGDVVLDVGANVGVAAAFFALECGAGRVHSFEPVEPIFRLLRENTENLPACVAHMYGISSSSGPSTITYYPAADAMSGLHADPQRDRELTEVVMRNRGLTSSEARQGAREKYEQVELTCELRTLSDAMSANGIERVDLLKIDVERAETDVLAGIGDPDWPRIRQVVAEVHDEGDRLAAFEATLADRGFLVSSEQEGSMLGTDVHVVYATRSSGG